MKLIVFLLTILSLTLNHFSCVTMTTNEYVFLDQQQPKQYNNNITITPVYINYKIKNKTNEREFDFSQYNTIFRKKWSKKNVYLGNVDMSYKPDCIKNNQITTIEHLKPSYFEQKELRENYYFLRLTSKLIKINIEQLNLENTRNVIDYCLHYKTHLITALDIQNKLSQKEKKNRIQKALKNARKRIKKNMKNNIVTCIESFSEDQTKQVIKENNVKNMKLLYQIAAKLHNLHEKAFHKDPSLDYPVSEGNILKTFFPKTTILLNNMRKNPSLTTEYNEDFDIFNTIPF